MSKTTSTMLLDAVNKQINEYFPSLTVHRRKAPSDFKRPCVLIRVQQIKKNKEAAYILNTQIIIRVLVFEELDEYGIPLEESVKETLMEFLTLGDLADNAEGFSVEVKDKETDEQGIAEIFDIIFSKISILQREDNTIMGEVRTRFGGNK